MSVERDEHTKKLEQAAIALHQSKVLLQQLHDDYNSIMSLTVDDTTRQQQLSKFYRKYATLLPTLAEQNKALAAIVDVEISPQQLKQLCPDNIIGIDGSRYEATGKTPISALMLTAHGESPIERTYEIKMYAGDKHRYKKNPDGSYTYTKKQSGIITEKLETIAELTSLFSDIELNRLDADNNKLSKSNMTNDGIFVQETVTIDTRDGKPQYTYQRSEQPKRKYDSLEQLLAGENIDPKSGETSLIDVGLYRAHGAAEEVCSLVTAEISAKEKPLYHGVLDYFALVQQITIGTLESAEIHNEKFENVVPAALQVLQQTIESIESKLPQLNFADDPVSKQQPTSSDQQQNGAAPTEKLAKMKLVSQQLLSLQHKLVKAAIPMGISSQDNQPFMDEIPDNLDQETQTAFRESFANYDFAQIKQSFATLLAQVAPIFDRALPTPIIMQLASEEKTHTVRGGQTEVQSTYTPGMPISEIISKAYGKTDFIEEFNITGLSGTIYRFKQEAEQLTYRGTKKDEKPSDTPVNRVEDAIPSDDLPHQLVKKREITGVGRGHEAFTAVLEDIYKKLTALGQHSEIINATAKLVSSLLKMAASLQKLTESLNIIEKASNNTLSPQETGALSLNMNEYITKSRECVRAIAYIEKFFEQEYLYHDLFTETLSDIINESKAISTTDEQIVKIEERIEEVLSDKSKTSSFFTSTGKSGTFQEVLAAQTERQKLQENRSRALTEIEEKTRNIQPASDTSLKF